MRFQNKKCILHRKKEDVRLCNHSRAFFCDDGGFSTVGMVLAMLITLALLFSTAQVYKIYSISADIQNISDVAALAAENQVASFYTTAQACDAVILSMNITACVTGGLGIVCACTPVTQPISAKLLDASRQVISARQKFSKKAAEGLNTFQKILPFIAATEGYAMAKANSSDISGYAGVALLVPQKGEEITINDGQALADVIDNAEDQADDIKEQAQKAEEASKRAKNSKHIAYMADCGNAPEYCMYERAKNVAGLDSASNPCPDSESAWTFSMALERSKAYYSFRLHHEKPDGDSVDAHADSQMRKRFYAFACEEIAKGYVHENNLNGTFEAYFPLLPRNTSEMRATTLYTDAIYPITQTDNAYIMHAWSGCPLAADNYCGNGSISDMEHGEFIQCPECKFTAASLGKVAAASTSIENGYEYNYRIVANQARVYQQARQEAKNATEEVKRPVKNLFEQFKEAFRSVCGQRIEVYPPGRYGAVSILVSTNQQNASSLIPNSFVAQTSPLSSRMALSAATLAPDEADDTNSALTTLFDRLSGGDLFGSKAPRIAIEIWSKSLQSWNKGEQAIDDTISSVASSLPLEDVCGLGKWALNTFRDTVENFGLEPVELSSYKAVTVNSSHVLSRDDSEFSQRIYQVKYTYQSMEGSGVGNPIASAIDTLNGKALEKTEDLSKPITVAHIEMFGEGGISIPVEVTLPPEVAEVSQSAINQAFDALRGATSSITEDRRWQ